MADDDATRKKGGKGRPGGAKSDAEAATIKDDAGAEGAADAGSETTPGPDIEAAVEEEEEGVEAAGPDEGTAGNPVETGEVGPVSYADLFRFHRKKHRR